MDKMKLNDDRFESRIVRCAVGGAHRWRWDAVKYRPAEGQFPGVYDRRVHMIGDGGYTRTWLGSALALARHLTKVAR